MPFPKLRKGDVVSVGSLSKSSVLTAAQVGSIYQENRKLLIGVAKRWVLDSDRAEEIVQDALIRVILAAPEITSVDHALNYLKKSVHSLCVDHLRIEGSKPNLVAIDDNASIAEELAATDPDFVDQLATIEDAALIREALSLLSPAERAALVMWELDGRSTEDIAAELGIKPKSVRHTLTRARTSLRRILSHLIVDEKNGLTALDLLSRTYVKSKDLAKKGSRVALSIVLVLGSFAVFRTVGSKEVESNQKQFSQSLIPSQDVKASLASEILKTSAQSKPVPMLGQKSSKVSSSSARASRVFFAGLDAYGYPTAFTVTDSNAKLGALFTSLRPAVIEDDEIVNSGILKTSKNGPNLLLTQVLTHGVEGLRFDGTLAFGLNGLWVPVDFSVISSEMERLASGNYLASISLQVKSAVDSSITIPASAGGWDLSALPSRVMLKVLLSPSKLDVLAEAVQLLEKESR